MEDIFWAPIGDEKYEKLKQAAMTGDNKMLNQAIESEIRLDAYFGNESSNDGRTALHIAAFQGHLNLVKTLLAHGVDVNIMERSDIAGAPPIYWAAEGAHANVVQYLLDAGARTTGIEGPNQNNLLSAVLRQPRPSNGKRIQTLEVLLDHGVDIDIRNPAGPTVLDIAISTENYDIISFLRDRGASFATSLDMAVRHKKFSLFPTLIEAGAVDTDLMALSTASRYGRLDMVNVLLQHRQSISLPTICSGPVCAAAQHGHLDVLEGLRQQGFPLNEPDNLGLTPLHHAVSSPRNSYKSMKWLLDRGADPFAVTVQGSKPWFCAGMTILHMAAKYCVLSVVETIIEVAPSLLHQRIGHGNHPADTPLLSFIRDIVEQKPYQIVGSETRAQALNVLINAGADIHAVDHQGRTCLHILADADYDERDPTLPDTIRLLLDRGAKKSTKDSNDLLAYQLASNETIKSLLSPAS